MSDIRTRLFQTTMRYFVRFYTNIEIMIIDYKTVWALIYSSHDAQAESMMACAAILLMCSGDDDSAFHFHSFFLHYVESAIWAYFLKGLLKMPQHLSIPLRFFSAWMRSSLITVKLSWIRSSCSFWSSNATMILIPASFAFSQYSAILRVLAND